MCAYVANSKEIKSAGDQKIRWKGYQEITIGLKQIYHGDRKLSGVEEFIVRR